MRLLKLLIKTSKEGKSHKTESGLEKVSLHIKLMHMLQDPFTGWNNN